MRAVGHQAMSVQIRLEEPLAERDRLLGAGGIEAVREPGLLAALHDEGAAIFVEAVRVDGEPSVLGALEDKREGVERKRRSQPHEAAGRPSKNRLKGSA